MNSILPLISQINSPAYITSYRAISILVALLCLGEFTRIVLAMYIMHKDSSRKTNQEIYGCMFIVALIFLLLAIKSMLNGIYAYHICIMGAYGLLYTVPTLLYIYLVRVAGKLIIQGDMHRWEGIFARLRRKEDKNHD